MKTLLAQKMSLSALIFTFTFFTISLIGQTECLDPDIFITDCGTEFDLCIDYSSTEVDQPVYIFVTSNDNLGIFDPCDIALPDDATLLPVNGDVELIQLGNTCVMRYAPDPGYVGLDSFKYILNFQDTCSNGYCEDPDEKIWTMRSLYYGPDNVRLELSAAGTVFQVIEELNNGDEFFIDGTGLDSKDNTSWLFKFYDKTCLDNSTHCKIINFDNLSTGEEVTNQYASLGVTISATNNNSNNPNKVIIFDSNNPSGGDLDLGTPNEDFGGPGIGAGGELGTPGENNVSLNNVLIIAEDDIDVNNDGFVDDPDDDAAGGFIEFLFDEPVFIESLKVLDLEEEAMNQIHVYDPLGNEIGTYPLHGFGDNSFQMQIIGIDNVARLEVEFESSGAIDELAFCRKADCELDVAEVPTTCESKIFGKDYGYFRPLAGCVALEEEKNQCNTSLLSDNQSSYRVATEVDVFQSDTTVVIVIIENANPLPIEFGAFYGRSMQGYNLVYWEILNIENEKSISLQKSHDGKLFETIQTFVSPESGKYHVKDEMITNKMTYYRIVSISNNGEKEYTRAIAIENNHSANSKIDIYPIPASDRINFDADQPIQQIRIFDLAGKELFFENFNNPSFALNLDGKDLNAGIYVCAITLENGSKTMKKIIISK